MQWRDDTTLSSRGLGRNRVKSGDRREKWNAFGTLLSSRIRLVSSHFASCKRFASSRSCPTIAVRRRWTALARSGYLIRDLANPCQPTTTRSRFENLDILQSLAWAQRINFRASNAEEPAIRRLLARSVAARSRGLLRPHGRCDVALPTRSDARDEGGDHVARRASESARDLGRERTKVPEQQAWRSDHAGRPRDL